MRFLFLLIITASVVSNSQTVIPENKAATAAAIARLSSLAKKCENEKNSEKRKALKERLENTEIDCDGVQSALNSLQGNTGTNNPDTLMCQKQLDAFVDAKKDFNKDCGPFSQCKDSSFLRCNEALKDVDAEDSEDGDDIEFLRACPFYVKDEGEKAKKRTEEFKESMLEKHDRLQELIKQLAEVNKEKRQEEAEIDKEVARLRGEAQTRLAESSKIISEINTRYGGQVNELRNEILALTSHIQTQKNKATASATVEYGKVITEIQKACYNEGLQAVAAEAARIRNPNGISSSYLRQVSAAGMIPFLKTVANKAYDECQASRRFSNDQKSADTIYQTQLSDIRTDIKSSEDRILAIQAEFKKLPLEVQQQITQEQGLGFVEAQNYEQQANAKMIEKQKLLQEKSGELAQLQGRIVELQQRQYADEKVLNTLLTKHKNISGISTTAAQTPEQFDKARGAYLNYEQARKDVTEHCCVGGRSLIGKWECNGGSDSFSPSSSKSVHD